MVHDIFADTSGLYAILVSSDDCHKKACQILKNASEKKIRFIVTDYILDETATLLRARGHTVSATDLFETIVASRACRIEWMDHDRFNHTKAFFSKHSDQDWSFTDCFSFVIMKELSIHDALTKDHHFTAAGFRALLS